MPNFSLFLAFIGAALLLAATPGPGILFVLAQTAKGGRRAGLSAAAGTAIGGLVHVVAGAFGLSTLVLSSAEVFSAIRTLGALYLFWLGVRALFERRELSYASLDEIALAKGSLAQGILTEALNPKTALFFLAFIPQFLRLEPGSGALAFAGPFIALGCISVFLNTLADIIVVFSAAGLVSRLKRSGKMSSLLRSVSSSMYFALGALAWRTRRDGGLA